MISKVNDFDIQKSKTIEDVFIFKPSVNYDLRGSLFTTYHNDVFKRYIPDDMFFKHDKFSKSYKHVLRGIHGDNKSWKCVTSVYGEVLQVIVDLRENSHSYLKYEKFLINEENQISILLPPGIGNSFLVLSDVAIYHYKLAYDGEYIDADKQFSVKWNDPRIAIEWPAVDMILSNRDG